MTIYSDEKLTYKIIMELGCCSESTAARRFKELKRAKHIQHHEELSVQDYVNYYRINPRKVVWRNEITHEDEIDLELPTLNLLC